MMHRLRLFEESYHSQMHALVKQVSSTSLLTSDSLPGGALGLSDFLVCEVQKLHREVITLSRARLPGPGVHQVKKRKLM